MAGMIRVLALKLCGIDVVLVFTMVWIPLRGGEPSMAGRGTVLFIKDSFRSIRRRVSFYRS
jgi:hypothetical protein